MPSTDFALTLELDPAKDGSWSQNETGKVYGIKVSRGRATALEPMRPGQMTLDMNNSDGRYSPDKGVISGLDQLIPVRLYATWTQAAVTNLLRNPSLESAITDWVAISATVVRDTIESYVGAASAKTTTTNVDASGLTVQAIIGGTRFAVTAGLAYTWGPRVKGPAAKAMKLRIRWFDSGSVNFATSEGAFTLGDGWINPNLTATAPTGAITALIDIVTSGAQGVFDFYTDAGFFYQSATLRLYVDGDQPGCTWSSAPHLSTSSRAANPQFLLFQGFIADIDIKQDKLDQTAQLTCIDGMGLWSQMPIFMGNMIKKGTALILHRLLDKAEGELISNPSTEWTAAAGYSPSNYAGIGGGTIAPNQIPVSTGDTLFFEGDWVIQALVPGSAGLEGWRYTATSDVPATGTYRASIYARSDTGTVAVRFRVLRDTTVIATTTVTLTTSWQRVELEFTLSTLGTNRYIELVTDVTSSVDFHSDGLHCVKKQNAIKRDFNAGAATLELVNAYDEEAARVIGDVLESEPGFAYVKARNLSEGDAVAFRDRNSRPSTAIARATFGDGDGLLEFEDGMGYNVAAEDRISSVKVSSRGTPVVALSEVGGWELAPKRTTVSGEKFKARYQQTLRRVLAIEKGGVDIANENKNFGAGHDIDVLTGAAGSWVAISGYPYNYPTEESVVRVEDAASVLPVKHELSVDMPLQGTNTTDMSNEATRLRDRYKNRIIRMSLPLHQWNDEVQSFQVGVDINDLLVVRAKYEPHSPGIDKKFWVEGIEHTIEGKGGIIHTTLMLEEL